MPRLSVMTQRYWKPLRAAVTGTVSIQSSAPARVTLFHVPPALRNCH